MALPARCTRRRSPSCCGCSWASRARCCTPPAARAAATAASGAPRRPTPDITDARARRPGPHRAARGARRAGRGRLAAVRLPFPQPHRRPRARGGRDGHQAPVRAAAPARRAGRRRASHRAAAVAGLPGRGTPLRLVAGAARAPAGAGRRQAARGGDLARPRPAPPPFRAPPRRAAARGGRGPPPAGRPARHPLRPQAGHVLLLDLWAGPALGAVFADQTWMAFAGKAPDADVKRVWQAVREARDAAVETLRKRWDGVGGNPKGLPGGRGEGSPPLSGADLDDAARAVIRDAGYAEFFVHRTGHSIDRDLHGSGPHLDNFETADSRPLVPGIGVSVEPGVYLPGRFGMRSEINVFLAESGPEVTPPAPQRDLFLV